MIPKTFAMATVLATLALVQVETVAQQSPAEAPARATYEEKLLAIEKLHEVERKAFEEKLELTLRFFQDKLDSKKEHLEVTQNVVTWWLGFVTLFLTLVGVALPVVFTLKLRGDYRAVVDETRKGLAQARDLVAEITQHRNKAAELLKQISPQISKEAPLSPDQASAVRTIAADPNAPARERLQALALEAQSVSNWTSAAALWKALTEIYPTDAAFWFGYAFASHNALSSRDANIPTETLRDIVSSYQKVIEIEPDNAAALNNLGNALSALAESMKRPEADRVFHEAQEKYKRALDLAPDDPETLLNWGISLVEQAKTQNDKEADNLYDQANAKYAQAARLNPRMQEAFFSWGNSLSNLAKKHQGEEADRLFDQAYEKYAKTVDIKPDRNEAFSNWGFALSNQARRKDGEIAERLFQQSYKKFEEAIRLKPDKHNTLFGWANALADHAKTKTGDEADRLFKQAYEKYARALELRPDITSVNAHWASALQAQAKTKTGDEADKLFTLAKQRLSPN